MIIHHTLVSIKGNNDQFEAINRTHKERFNFQSEFGIYVGYQYLIRSDGRVKQCRKDTEVGAHCREGYMNFKSIGICLEGNFDVDKPTDKQIFALRDLMRRLSKKYGIPKERVLFHRNYATYKSCPGKNVSQGFIQSLLDVKPAPTPVKK